MFLLTPLRLRKSERNTCTHLFSLQCFSTAHHIHLHPSTRFLLSQFIHETIESQSESHIQRSGLAELECTPSSRGHEKL